MKTTTRWIADLGGLLLALVVTTFPAQAVAQPCGAGPGVNPNGHSAGAGKACTKPGQKSNVGEFQPIHLKLVPAGAGCPTTVDVDLKSAPIYWDHYPDKVNWIIEGKKQGTTWTIWGGGATDANGDPIGMNPFPDPIDPVSNKPKKRTISGDQNAYWSEQPTEPTNVQGAIEWKYFVEVDGIEDAQGHPCPRITIDPIILWPGG